MASTSASEGSSKGPSLKTSKEVYDMVRTDPGYDGRSCHIVYHDRVADRWMSCSVADWVPASAQGDVPWHRVWFIKYKDVVFWDREKRFFDPDLLRRLAMGEEEPPYANFVAATDRLAGALPRSFAVATFNVLFDLYDYRVTKLEPRLPRISDALSRLDADVILLQECTPKVLEFLQAQPWVRARYNVAHTDLEPYGQITMARASTLRIRQHFLTSHKKALHTVFEMEGDLTVGVWNVHLPLADDQELDFSSTRSRPVTNQGPGRAKQLEQIKQWVEIAEDSASIVGGDFNARSRGKTDMGPFEDTVRWRDAWKVHQPNDPGPTFDPSANTLAEHNSRTGQAERLDRILLRSEVLQVRSVEIFGSVTPPLSDHFGVLATLAVDSARAADDVDPHAPAHSSAQDDEGHTPLSGSELSVKTAVVWIPPPESSCQLDKIRRRLDPKIDRWMCHVAVSYPFIREQEFSRVASSMSADTIPPAFPFGSDSTLTVFDHEGSASVVTQPGPEGCHSFRSVRAQFAALLEHASGDTREYRPHLTIGRFKKDGDGPSREALAALNSNENAVLAMADTWRVERLCLISREESTHFIVKKIVELPGSKPLAAEDIVAGLEAGLDTYRWHAVGAHLLGAETADSDCDVLAVGSDGHAEATARVQRFVETSGLFFDVRLVSNPHGSYIKARAAGGRHVDVHYLPWHAEKAPWDMSSAELAKAMGDASESQATVLSMVSEPAKILDFVSRKSRREVFGQVLRSVKIWAKQMGLYGQVFGFPGGITWAIMTAKAMERCPTEMDCDCILQQVCETFGAWKWESIPVTLGQESSSIPNSSRAADVLMRVPLTTMLNVNTMRTVLASTREMLICAFQAGPEGASTALAELKRRLPNVLTLTVQAEDEDGATCASTWISRQLARFLVAAERLGGQVAPDCDWTSFKDDPGTLSWSVRHLRDNTGVAGLAHKLQERFYREVPRAALLFEIKGS